MVPLSEAINSGIWIKAEYKENEDNYVFQMKPTSFTKINLKNDVDDPIKLGHIDVSSNVWLLKVEVVNLCRQKVESSYMITGRLVLVDDDGYEFPTTDDWHLNLISDYANKTGLRRFFGTDLPPKIKRKGAVAFELPDTFDELYLSVRNGATVEA